MRFADLFRLSLSALWQQKTRAALTTLGVVFGALVLVFSLSLGQGVQDTIERESPRNLFLRTIDVHPRWQGDEADVPQEKVRVEGEMSDDKRRRIREALVQQHLQYAPKGPKVALTRDRLAALRELEHVAAVVPIIHESPWATLGDRTQQVSTSSTEPDNDYHRRRLVAGEFFARPDERSAVVSEFFCYRLGIADDDAVRRVIGQKLRLEFRSQPPTTGLHLYLVKGDGQPHTKEEDAALDNVRRQLPAALDRLELSRDDLRALRLALQEPPTTTVYQEELTVVGVVRLPTKEERDRLWDPANQDADVLVPTQTAEEIFFRRKEAAEFGVHRATIRVDREENVKPVLAQVTAMKLQARAPLESIERVRFMYLMIFGTMACVAAVALVVAGLGITNTMLMSVLERTREIGIFKAVGAGDGTVQLIFLIEGAFIGLLGGAGGLLLGWAASFPADAWVRGMASRDMKIELKESLFVFPWWLTCVVLFFAVAVTTLAAVFPARRAARVNPVTALRNE
jgi:putative ABC transport system permease protein